MRFRKALLTVALSMGITGGLTLTTPGAAQEARQVDISYEITFAGLSGFRIDLTARFNGAKYDVALASADDGRCGNGQAAAHRVADQDMSKHARF